MVRSDYLLSHFVKNYWSEVQSLTFNETAFQHVYDRLEDFLYATHLRTEVLAPLDNYVSSEACVVLGEGLAIRSLSKPELQEMYATESVFRDVYKDRLTDIPGCAIVLEKDEPKILGEGTHQNEAAIQVVNDVVSTLRIHKPGFVTYQIIRIGEGPKEWGLFPSYYWERKPTRFRPTYHLDTRDAAQLRDLWHAYRTVSWDRHRFLRVAVDRLNFGAERSRAEDQLVDYVVSLEALFGKADEKEGIGFRLAMRGARFLGSDAAERLSIYRDLKAAYRARSDIVHGKPDPKVAGGGNLEEFAGRIEEYVRSGLKKFMERGKGGVKSQLVDWDSLMLG